jgi:hypothetical protein
MGLAGSKALGLGPLWHLRRWRESWTSPASGVIVPTVAPVWSGGIPTIPAPLPIAIATVGSAIVTAPARTSLAARSTAIATARISRSPRRSGLDDRLEVTATEDLDPIGRLGALAATDDPDHVDAVEPLLDLDAQDRPDRGLRREQ